MNDTWIIMRSQLVMWHQKMQVSCDKNHIFKSDYFLWWYQNEFVKIEMIIDWKNSWNIHDV